MGGNFAVGLVVFLILVIINFMVITKGAGRIAEVGARFVLDAMPGFSALIVGNHDVHDDTSLYRRHGHVVERSETVFFDELHGTTNHLLDGDLVLWGRAMDEHSQRYRPLHGVVDRPEHDAWYVVLGHGLHIGDDPIDGAGRSIIAAITLAGDPPVMARLPVIIS